jgi:EF hand
MTINMRGDLSRRRAAYKARPPVIQSFPNGNNLTASGNTAASISLYQRKQRYPETREQTMKALIPALALLALPALALAQPPGGGGGGPPRQPQTPEQVEASFKAMDTNHDGVVTKDEWTAAGRREQGFTRFDTKGDGKITLDEMKAVTAQFAAGGGGGGRGPGGPPAGGQ